MFPSPSIPKDCCYVASKLYPLFTSQFPSPSIPKDCCYLAEYLIQFLPKDVSITFNPKGLLLPKRPSRLRRPRPVSITFNPKGLLLLDPELITFVTKAVSITFNPKGLLLRCKTFSVLWCRYWFPSPSIPKDCCYDQCDAAEVPFFMFPSPSIPKDCCYGVIYLVSLIVLGFHHLQSQRIVVTVENRELVTMARVSITFNPKGLLLQA